jgi:hypothetical protein
MTLNNLSFVSFEPRDGKFIGFLSMEAAIGSERDPEAILHKATKIYERSIIRIRSILVEIKSARANRKPIAARKIWQIGDIIFELRDNLEKLSLQLDGVYVHLVRDLGVKRKWLEKVIILRRYLPIESLVPKSLNWGRCEKGTRRVAERLSKRLSLD